MTRLDQIDDNITRFHLPRLKMRASDYMRTRVWHGFVLDTAASYTTPYVGASQVLWGSDFPHFRSIGLEAQATLHELVGAHASGGAGEGGGWQRRDGIQPGLSWPKSNRGTMVAPRLHPKAVSSEMQEVTHFYAKETHAESEVNGAEIYYEEAGSGPPMILSPGGLQGVLESYQPVLEELSRAHRVIAYDRRFGGQSKSPSGGTNLGPGLSRRRRAHGCPGHRPGFLGGGSFGAAISLGCAARYPDRVKPSSRQPRRWRYL